MKISYNGDETITYCSTLEDFCKEKKLSLESIATAMNGIFVPRNLRPSTLLEEGDKIDIVVPIQGG